MILLFFMLNTYIFFWLWPLMLDLYNSENIFYNIWSIWPWACWWSQSRQPPLPRTTPSPIFTSANCSNLYSSPTITLFTKSESRSLLQLAPTVNLTPKTPVNPNIIITKSTTSNLSKKKTHQIASKKEEGEQIQPLIETTKASIKNW